MNDRKASNLDETKCNTATIFVWHVYNGIQWQKQHGGGCFCKALYGYLSLKFDKNKFQINIPHGCTIWENWIIFKLLTVRQAQDKPEKPPPWRSNMTGPAFPFSYTRKLYFSLRLLTFIRQHQPFKSPLRLHCSLCYTKLQKHVSR